jgi:gliding motility-associated-like protein
MVDDTHSPSSSTGYSIGFDFCFFGEVYDHFWIASNGWIMFENPTSAMDVNWTPDGPVPDDASNVPHPAVYGPWEDWHTGLCSSCIHYETTGTAPNRKLIVTWEDVPLFLCTSNEGTFQIVLHETTNIIDNHLTEIPSCSSWGGGYSVQGIEDETGDEAYAAPDRNYDVWETSDESNRWVPNSINWYETATGTFIATGDSIIVNPTVTTTYTAEITLCDGTTVSDDVTVTIAVPYEVTYELQNIQCFGDGDGFIDLTITGNSNPMIYSWASGETTEDLTDLSPGDYSVTIEEEDGCITYFDFTITEPPLLTLDTTETHNIVCNSDNDGFIYMIAAGGTEPYTFTLNNDDPQSSANFDGLTAGDYTITVTDEYGCQETFEVTLTEPEAVTVDAGADQVMQFGGYVNINAVSNATTLSSILWSPPVQLSCIDCLTPEATPDNTITYTITVENEFGCSASDDITVFVQYDYAIANVFSPNGDGINDIFHLDADFITGLELYIYDRWGELVYKTTDMRSGWDGNMKGKPAELGTYTYILTTFNVDASESTRTGTILLLR